MRILKSLTFLFLFVFFTTGCKIEYRPAVTSPVTGYLVVEGFINSDADQQQLHFAHALKFMTIQQPTTGNIMPW